MNEQEKVDWLVRSLNSINQQLSKDKIIKEQIEDPVLGIVRKWVKDQKSGIREQQKELKFYYQICDTLI